MTIIKLYKYHIKLREFEQSEIIENHWWLRKAEKNIRLCYDLAEEHLLWSDILLIIQ